MARRVVAENLRDPEGAQALRDHRAERARLLEGLGKAFRADSTVRAVWFGGSFARGEADDLSDLDLWLGVADSAATKMAGPLAKACAGVGEIVSAIENPRNAPQGGGYLGVLMAGTHGLHPIDLYWQTATSVAVPDGPLLMDRRQEAAEPPEPPVEPLVPTAPVVEKLAFLWLMLSVLAKHLAREPGSDMALLRYPRAAFEELTAELREAGGPIDWTVPELPAAKMALLRRVAEKTRLLEAAARRRGMAVSGEANPCLMRYLDLVARILDQDAPSADAGSLLSR